MYLRTHFNQSRVEKSFYNLAAFRVCIKITKGEQIRIFRVEADVRGGGYFHLRPRTAPVVSRSGDARACASNCLYPNLPIILPAVMNPL